MAGDLFLKRKWTFRTGGKQVVFAKRANERTEHVLMKAFLWSLYLKEYPDLLVEISIGDRYKPDVVSLGPDGPRFWGEAGEVGKRKIASLARRYRATRFAIGKWAVSLQPLATIVSKACHGLRRSAPFELIAFPDDAAERFIDDDGNVRVAERHITRIRIPELER